MKWIIRIVGALVLVAVLMLMGLLLLPADRIAAIAGDQLRKLTGREVTISGDVQMTFWPVLGVSAEGLEVGNADWAKEGAMLSTRNAAIGVDAMSLLRGDIRITNIRAESPTIRLEARKDGRASWLFTDAGGKAQIETETAPTRAPRSFSIEKLEITDATLIYDAEGADLVRYEGVDLALDWPDRGGAAEIRAAIRPAGQVVRVDATVERFAGFLAGDVQPLSFTLAANGGDLTLKGRGALDGSVAGKVGLKTRDTGAFLAALGAGGADLPEGLGRRANVTTDLTLTPDRRLALRDLVADLGGNTLRGAADIELNGTPQVNAQLSAGALDLRSLTGGGGESGGQSGSTGWSRAPIDASGLAAFNGAIALSADSVDLGALTFGATRALVTNESSRMVFGLREVRAYDGVLTGEFVMNNRSGLSVGGNLRAAGIALNPLLRDLAGLTRFTGDATVELSFLGVGQSVDAIMRSLSGKGLIAVGRGSIEGIDLDDLLGNFDVQGGTTVFDSANATFAMQGGVARNDDLRLVLPNFEATGEGEVNLGAQTLDYTFTPKA
ncbi:MAG: AsmA family protein, partial [Sulfitobacter sp.]|nr:AsmA family protein [Sulfitobacter sp.]